MRCPYCTDTSNRVIDTRDTADDQEIRRRRQCEECGQRFTTRERVEDVLPKIVKHDERREEFRRQKLVESIQKACAKRPVSADALEQLVDRVERFAQEYGEKEVTSHVVGNKVLDELSRLDAIAATRYASVFLNFQDADDYAKYFASIEGRTEAP